MNPASSEVGCSVRLLTTLDEVIEGTVFAFDRLSNCVTLSQPGATPETVDFRVVKASCVKSVLSARLADASFDFTLPSLHLAEGTAPDRPQDDEEEVMRWDDEEEAEEEDRGEMAVMEAPCKDRESSVEAYPEEEVERPMTPEETRRLDDPWGLKQRRAVDETKRSPAPTASSYAAVSKGVEHRSQPTTSPAPAPAPVPDPAPLVPSAAPPIVPKGVWGKKNPRISQSVSYSQVASGNANPAPVAQPEATKTREGGDKMVTMTLSKSRPAMRN